MESAHFGDHHNINILHSDIIGLIMKRHLIFIDFDGTITYNDVGYELFKKFSDTRTEPVVQEYRNGKINSRQCLYEECMILNERPTDPDKVFDFLDKQILSPGFYNLYRYEQAEMEHDLKMPSVPATA